MAARVSHVLLTRPRPESEELAARLAPLGLAPVILPAFEFQAVDLAAEQPADFELLRQADARDLVIFTSPRAVEFGVAQAPPEALARARVHAIGPSTASALARVGVRACTAPAGGYTSEALLQSLAAGAAPAGGVARAFIVAAPGGREAMAEGLGELGWRVRMLWVYRSRPAPLARDQLERLGEAAGVLSIWTSGNTMKALSQRLPPAAWFRVCQGPWLVISDRLERLARAYGPPAVHRAGGPDNAAIVASVRALLAGSG